MKINDIVVEDDQVKQDAKKVIDLIKSNQSVNIAVDTYMNIHSGKLDYDAAYSKASQKAFGKRVTKSGEAPDPADVDRMRQKEIDAQDIRNMLGLADKSKVINLLKEILQMFDAQK